MRTRKYVVSASVAMALLVSACGGSAGDGDSATSPAPTPPQQQAEQAPATGSLDALIAAAQQEGEFLLYVALSDIGDATCPAFEAKYGITCEFIRIPTGDQIARHVAEVSAGSRTADMLMNSDAGPPARLVADGVALTYDQARGPYEILPSNYPTQFLHDGERVVVTSQPWALGWNTNLVSAEEAPKSYTDIIQNPAWANGRTIIPQPTLSGVYVDFYDLLEKEFGTEFLDAFVAHRPLFYDGGGAPSVEALSAGEGAVMMPVAISQILAAQGRGAPVDYYVPDITPATRPVAQITSAAASPNAALLYLHFLLHEGAEIVADALGVLSILDPRVADYLHHPNGKGPGMPSPEGDRLFAMFGLR